MPTDAASNIYRLRYNLYLHQNVLFTFVTLLYC